MVSLMDLGIGCLELHKTISNIVIELSLLTLSGSPIGPIPYRGIRIW